MVAAKAKTNQGSGVLGSDNPKESGHLLSQEPRNRKKVTSRSKRVTCGSPVRADVRLYGLMAFACRYPNSRCSESTVVAPLVPFEMMAVSTFKHLRPKDWEWTLPPAKHE